VTVHDFSASLRRSRAYADLPVWEQVYRSAFIGFQQRITHHADGSHQRQGVDCSIILENSKQILVDEKVRFRNEKTGKVYRDIALEFLSDRERRTPGWVCKPLLADYIAYLIAPAGICHFIPVLQLQQAWKRHGEVWRQRFRVIESENTSWVTMSCCVPADVLYPAIGACLRVQFSPFEEAA
jgi:hypothetical protein